MDRVKARSSNSLLCSDIANAATGFGDRQCFVFRSLGISAAYRRERITLQDINFAGPDQDIYNVRLLSDALPDFDTAAPHSKVEQSACWQAFWSCSFVEVYFSMQKCF